jgi:hypothetical protein
MSAVDRDDRALAREHVHICGDIHTSPNTSPSALIVNEPLHRSFFSILVSVTPGMALTALRKEKNTAFMAS